MNKYIILFLYILLFTFSFQYFFSQEKSSITTQNGVLLSIVDDTLVIPNTPQIEIQNHSASGFIISPCRDISINIDSQPLVDVEKSAPKFCQDISIEAGSKAKIPMSELSMIMANLPGKYLITVKTPL
jgi:hypothetical protein